MYESTYASLFLAGTIASAEGARALLAEITQQGGRVDGLHPVAPTAPGPMPTHYGFDEITGGDIPTSLRALLHSLGLSYFWKHGQTSSFGAQATVVIGQASHHQPLSDNDEPFLEYADLDNTEKRDAIAAYLDAKAQVLGQPLHYAPSAHAMLAHKAKAI